MPWSMRTASSVRGPSSRVAHLGAPGRGEGFGREGVKLREPVGDAWGPAHHSRAIIRQLSPLPIPIRATSVAFAHGLRIDRSRKEQIAAPGWITYCCGGGFHARPAVIPVLMFGKATLHNIAAYVVADEDLDSQQVKLKTKALLGYPVIAALGRLTFRKDGSLTISATSPARDLRMASALWYGNHSLVIELATQVLESEGKISLRSADRLLRVRRGTAGPRAATGRQRVADLRSPRNHRQRRVGRRLGAGRSRSRRRRRARRRRTRGRRRGRRRRGRRRHRSRGSRRSAGRRRTPGRTGDRPTPDSVPNDRRRPRRRRRRPEHVPGHNHHANPMPHVSPRELETTHAPPETHNHTQPTKRAAIPPRAIASLPAIPHSLGTTPRLNDHRQRSTNARRTRDRRQPPRRRSQSTTLIGRLRGNHSSRPRQAPKHKDTKDQQHPPVAHIEAHSPCPRSSQFSVQPMSRAPCSMLTTWWSDVASRTTAGSVDRGRFEFIQSWAALFGGKLSMDAVGIAVPQSAAIRNARIRKQSRHAPISPVGVACLGPSLARNFT